MTDIFSVHLEPLKTHYDWRLNPKVRRFDTLVMQETFTSRPGGQE